MDYALTEHARDALKKRQIKVAWMEQVLTAPEVIEPIRWTRTWNIVWPALLSSAIGCYG